MRKLPTKCKCFFERILKLSSFAFNKTKVKLYTNLEKSIIRLKGALIFIVFAFELIIILIMTNSNTLQRKMQFMANNDDCNLVNFPDWN